MSSVARTSTEPTRARRPPPRAPRAVAPPAPAGRPPEAPAWTPPPRAAERRRHGWAFAVGSAALHVGLLLLVPAFAGPAPSPRTPDVVAFSLLAPPPLPAAAEPPPAPEPPPPTRKAAAPEPPPPEASPPPPAEDAPPLGAEDLVAETHEVQVDTVASTEGGLAVRARAGDGAGLAPTRAGRAGAPDGRAEPAATVDPRALLRAWMIQVQRRVSALAAEGYPLAARRAQLEGVVTLALRIDPEGRLVAVDVAESCGHEVLDAAAAAAARELGAVPAPPEALAWATRPVRLPIRYSIR